LSFGVFDEPVHAHVLDDTPSVLSMGKRCLDQGYTFVWPAGKDPFMIDQNDMVITMKDHIPYISIDQVKEYGDQEKIRRLLNELDDECSTSEGEGTIILDGESGEEMIENPSQKAKVKMLTKKVGRKRKQRRRTPKVSEVSVGGEVAEYYEVADDDDSDEDVGSRHGRSDAEVMPDVGHDIEIDDQDVGDEDDEDIVDVDEEDGEPRLSKRGALKGEAKTKEHLLTHRFKNPYCESCVRAKVKHRKTFRGAFPRKLTKFGDLVTFDYVDNRQVYEQDYGVEKTIFVIRDRYAGMIQAHPSARKDTDAVIGAVKQFMGRRKIREAYSDQAPQLTETMKALKIPCDDSLAGKTKHNSLAGRNNQFLLVATTTCMLEAGIPPCFWKFAIRCVSPVERGAQRSGS